MVMAIDALDYPIGDKEIFVIINIELILSKFVQYLVYYLHVDVLVLAVILRL